MNDSTFLQNMFNFKLYFVILLTSNNDRSSCEFKIAVGRTTIVIDFNKILINCEDQ